MSVSAQGRERRFQDSESIALYIHIPFCLRRCYFCTFTVVVGDRVTETRIASYLSALERELLSYANELKKHAIPIHTIQIGGGTPTTLSHEQLTWLIELVHEQFDCSQLHEIIIEGFPTSVTPEKLAALVKYPQLKFNIGVQTFDNQALRLIGREHEGNEAIEAINAAVATGFPSVGVDLIYGLPLSSPEAVVRDVERVVGLGVDHIALYPLWIYPKTKLATLCKSEKLVLPTHADRRAQLRAAAEKLQAHDFHRYTAFHYSLGGRTQHRYGVWQMEDRDWLGAGQGAVSYIDGTLYQNDRSLDRYIDKSLRGVDACIEHRTLSLQERLVRALVYGLRLSPMPMSRLREKYGCELESVFSEQLAVLERDGFIERGTGVQLTDDGVLSLGCVEAYLEQREVDHD
jgi:oxygen-independent coproporphyrinogen-3 oxidase